MVIREPTFSIIMASFNHEKYLPEVIDSILGQTYQDFTLLIIDDSSTDGSRRIIQEYVKRDHRIKAIFHEHNQGIARTFNHGLSLVNGKYLVLSSSDDPYEPERLEIINQVFTDHPSVGLVSSDAYLWRVDDKTGQVKSNPIGEAPLSIDILNELIIRNVIVAPSVVIRSNVIGNTRFDERLKYLNDWLFWIIILSRANYYYIDKPLLKYRRHVSNTDRDWVGYAGDYLIMEKLLNEQIGLVGDVQTLWSERVVRNAILLVPFKLRKWAIFEAMQLSILIVEKILLNPSLIKKTIIPSISNVISRFIECSEE